MAGCPPRCGSPGGTGGSGRRAYGDGAQRGLPRGGGGEGDQKEGRRLRRAARTPPRRRRRRGRWSLAPRRPREDQRSGRGAGAQPHDTHTKRSGRARGRWRPAPRRPREDSRSPTTKGRGSEGGEKASEGKGTHTPPATQPTTRDLQITEGDRGCGSGARGGDAGWDRGRWCSRWERGR